MYGLMVEGLVELGGMVNHVDLMRLVDLMGRGVRGRTRVCMNSVIMFLICCWKVVAGYLSEFPTIKDAES